MRILHIVSFVSPDGAYGGPVSVAENHAAALRQRGHVVTVVAGQRGYDPPLESNGHLRLFGAHKVLPQQSFAAIAAPAMLPWLRRQLRHTDVVHLHLARDLLTTPAGRIVQRSGVPYVVQPHGMIEPRADRLARTLDVVAIRPILRGARRVFYLRDAERRSLESVAGAALSAEQLPNAVPVVEHPPPLPSRPEVLYCGRLHSRKRPLPFVEMATALLDEGIDASFVLVGPDEGEGPAVRTVIERIGDPTRLRWEGPLGRALVLERMGRSSMLVMPSIHETYPMSALEAMSVGRPVVVTSSNGLAPEVLANNAGVVVEPTVAALTEGVRALLTDPSRIETMGRDAWRATREHFSLDAVADRLEAAYGQAAGR